VGFAFGVGAAGSIGGCNMDTESNKKTNLIVIDSRNKSQTEQDAQEPFVMCPKAFYAGLTEEEIRAMQQIYRVAFEKARQRVQSRTHGFYNGDGI
jgi:hypothetical protein